MLMDMKARTEAMRALACYTAGQMDVARGHPEAVRGELSQRLVDLLTPVVKGWCTETAVGVASTGIQVHGGMGYIEETGASQYLRDARITTIYEGTTGIQANDLVGRKLARDQGAAMAALQEEIAGEVRVLQNDADADLKAIAIALDRGTAALVHGTHWMLQAQATDPRAAAAVAVPYLKLAGTVAGAWLLARSARRAASLLAAGEGEEGFLRAKVTTARFYAEHVLPEAFACRDTVVHGAGSVLALDESQF